MRTLVAASLLSGLLLALLPPTAPAQQGMDDVEIQVVDVAPGLHMLIGQGGNIAVSTGKDGPVVVDDQYAPLVPKILAAVRTLQDAPVRFVINTHWHGDHTGGNEALGAAGALILAHDNVRRRLVEGANVPEVQRVIPPAPPGALPVLTFSETTTLHWNGGTIRIEHVAPAHTDGDAVVWFPEANAVHAGDTYFNGMYPFVDVWSGGSIDGMIAAADGILARTDAATKVMPGHGPLSNAAELRAYRDLLATVRARVGAAIAAGKDVEALLAERPTAEYDRAWGGGFLDAERFLRLIYADLSD